MALLCGLKVAVLAADGVEQEDMVTGWKELRNAGVAVSLVSLGRGRIQGYVRGGRTSSFLVDKSLGEVVASDFDALVIPGGLAHVELLKSDPAAVAFVRAFMSLGRPVAAICRAVALLSAAGSIGGRTVAGHPDLSVEVRALGARWVDEDVCVDGVLVTACGLGNARSLWSRFACILSGVAVEERIDRGLEQSFPASDPPSFSQSADPLSDCQAPL